MPALPAPSAKQGSRYIIALDAALSRPEPQSAYIQKPGRAKPKPTLSPPQWPWYCLQSSVALGILAADIEWRWNTSGNPMVGLLASIVGAFVATKIAAGIIWLFRLILRFSDPAVTDQTGRHDRSLG